LFTLEVQALFDEWLADVAASRSAMLDRRDQIFARHIVEATRQLALSQGPGRFSVAVFVGTGHVPGVVRRVREALGINVDHEPIDIDEIIKQALWAVDRTSDMSVRRQIMEFVNAHAVAVVETELPNSIARYAALVDEVRNAARQGRQIVFFAEFDASLLVEALSAIRNAGLYDAFKTALAHHVFRRGEAYEQLDPEAEAIRLFPFFFMGPAGLIIAKLNERDVPVLFLQSSER